MVQLSKSAVLVISQQESGVNSHQPNKDEEQEAKEQLVEEQDEENNRNNVTKNGCVYDGDNDNPKQT